MELSSPRVTLLSQNQHSTPVVGRVHFAGPARLTARRCRARAFERRFLQAPARYRKQNEGKCETSAARRIQAA